MNFYETNAGDQRSFNFQLPEKYLASEIWTWSTETSLLGIYPYLANASLISNIRILRVDRCSCTHLLMLLYLFIRTPYITAPSLPFTSWLLLITAKDIVRVAEEAEAAAATCSSIPSSSDTKENETEEDQNMTCDTTTNNAQKPTEQVSKI